MLVLAFMSLHGMFVCLLRNAFPCKRFMQVQYSINAALAAQNETVHSYHYL